MKKEDYPCSSPIFQFIRDAWGRLAFNRLLGLFWTVLPQNMGNITPPGTLSWRLIIGLFITLVAGVTLSSCGALGERGPGAVRKWPARPWSSGFVYLTPHYSVHTNTSAEVATYIGELMEKAFSEYCALLECKVGSLPCLNIRAYSTRKEYEDVVLGLGLPPDITSGLYSPVPPAAIHIPYVRDLKVHPSVTLLHEGLHQFVDQAMRFEVPLEAREALSAPSHTLVSIPLWLNEGLATYMESAVLRENRLEIGWINKKRLVHLQKLIRAKNCPSLQNVIAQPYGRPFMAVDYAVAWGVVYSLRHAPRGDEQADRRKRLLQYVESCKQAFFTNATSEFLPHFLTEGRAVEDFDYVWAEHIGKRSLEVFEQIIVGEEATLDVWERDWSARILQLNPREPYGGLPASL